MIDWTHWHNERLLVGGLVLFAWAYAVLTGPFRSWIAPDQAFPRGKAVLFFCSLVIFYLSVGSPLDQLGERYLLSAHMFQHQLLTFAAAPLFLAGLPHWLLTPALGAPAFRLIWKTATNPIVCGVVYCVVISGWHMPMLYDLALQDRTVHIVEHFMFFGASLFFWWPVCSPSREFPPTSYPWQMFYVVAVTIGMTPAFAYITFSRDVLYPTYEFAPRITDLSPIQDQVLAGTMMKLIGMSVMMVIFAAAFYRWYRATEHGGGPAKPPL